MPQRTGAGYEDDDYKLNMTLSKAKLIVESMITSKFDESIDATIARSQAGSETLRPPAILRKTSF